MSKREKRLWPSLACFPSFFFIYIFVGNICISKTRLKPFAKKARKREKGQKSIKWSLRTVDLGQIEMEMLWIDNRIN